MKILVVEGDKSVARELARILTHHNYAVEVVNSPEAAWSLAEDFEYDLVLLDVHHKPRVGIDFCSHLRSQGLQMPVLLLADQSNSHDRAIALDAGADDLIGKPIDPEELIACVRALLRRGSAIAQPILRWGKLRLDPTSCQVMYGTELLPLTPTEYKLLELFLRHHRRVFSCDAILEHLWSYEAAPGEEAVRTHIKGLRHKLKAVGAPSDLVETVYGIGYRLKPEETLTHLSDSLWTECLGTENADRLHRFRSGDLKRHSLEAFPSNGSGIGSSIGQPNQEKIVVNLTAPIVAKEVETILETYPYQTQLHFESTPGMREELIAYVLSRVHCVHIAVYSKDLVTLSHKTLPYSTEKKLHIESIIHKGIQHVLHKHEVNLHPVPSPYVESV
jgi:DNA-binding response OmpR family regulator